jgi:serine/threonine protein phosphatase 1
VSGRIFAVGDVHGRLDKLETLLGRLPLEPDDRLVFLGDYLNRGVEASWVLDRLLALRAERPGTVFLKGNHEQEVLRYGRTRDPEDLRHLRDIGFQATLDSYGSASSCGLDFMPVEHEEFLEGLLPCWESGPWVFFHAPLVYGRNPAEATPAELENLLSNRELDGPGWAASGRTLVFGHIPLETPLVAPGLLGIDTGAAHGHLLTAVELPALRFFHA